jgi:hypothetical protein
MKSFLYDVGVGVTVFVTGYVVIATGKALICRVMAPRLAAPREAT